MHSTVDECININEVNMEIKARESKKEMTKALAFLKSIELTTGYDTPSEDELSDAGTGVED